MTENAETAEPIGLDVSILTEVLEGGDAEARIVLARQLAALLADPETPDIEREQVLPVVLKLAVDEEIEVRRILADEFTTVSDLAPDILFSIVADTEEIALPFIANTMSMQTNHMFAILRVGDDARQAMIARRPDITAEVAAYIIAHGKAGGCLALLDSPLVQFGADDYRVIFQRHGSVPEVVERLLAIPTLPTDIRIQQLRKTSSRMRQMMAERAWLPANDALDLVTDAEDSTILRILTEANVDELSPTVSYLASRELLTPSLIVRAASRGEMRVVEALFSHLTGYSHERVCTMMYRQRQSSYNTLFKKSGLPKVCYGILHAACEVQADIAQDDVRIDKESFGRLLLEALMTRYDQMSPVEREKQIDYLGRYAEGRVRRIAQRLKADFARAA
jgi:uncharacterized protein (DUF2336 family)